MKADLKAKWQPIETAPKDGTDILVYCGPAFDPMWGIASWHEPMGEEYGDSAPAGWTMWWSGHLNRHTWPTHWLPLPAPPEIADEESR